MYLEKILKVVQSDTLPSTLQKRDTKITTLLYTNVNPITVSKITSLYSNTFVTWPVNCHDCILLTYFYMVIGSP
jgi:hypothetical protein